VGVVALAVASSVLVGLPVGRAGAGSVVPFVPGSSWELLRELGVKGPAGIPSGRSDAGGPVLAGSGRAVDPDEGVLPSAGESKVDSDRFGESRMELPKGLADGDARAVADATGKVADVVDEFGVQPGVIDALTTESSLTTQNADGSRTLELSAGVERVRDPVSGAWRELDSTAVVSERGFEPTVGLREVVVPGSSAGPGVLGSSAGDFAVSWVGASDAAGVASGNVVRYPGALGGRDLLVELSDSGWEEIVVVPDRASGSGYEVDVVLPDGVSPVESPEGIVFVDAKGVAVGGFGGGIAFDANTKATDGSGLIGVSVSLVSAGVGRARLRVSVDAGWFADPARVFPISIDPWSTIARLRTI
jgi:hypothetical protein